jgi:hypothetical protein
MGTTSNSIMSTKLPIWRGRGEVVVGFGCKYKKEVAREHRHRNLQTPTPHLHVPQQHARAYTLFPKCSAA